MKIKLPIKVTNEANSREHWHKKALRHSRQKDAIRFSLCSKISDTLLPCTIKLTRIAPRKMDIWDNIPMGFKFILDAICELLIPGKAIGQADNDSRIRVEYDQKKGEKGEYAIEIEIIQSG